MITNKDQDKNVVKFSRISNGGFIMVVPDDKAELQKIGDRYVYIVKGDANDTYEIARRF